MRPRGREKIREKTASTFTVLISCLSLIENQLSLDTFSRIRPSFLRTRQKTPSATLFQLFELGFLRLLVLWAPHNNDVAWDNGWSMGNPKMARTHILQTNSSTTVILSKCPTLCLIPFWVVLFSLAENKRAGHLCNKPEWMRACVFFLLQKRPHLSLFIAFCPISATNSCLAGFLKKPENTSDSRVPDSLSACNSNF